MKTLNYGQTQVTIKERKTKNAIRLDVDIKGGLDECMEYPTIETELSNNTSLFLTNLFKNLH